MTQAEIVNEIRSKRLVFLYILMLVMQWALLPLCVPHLSKEAFIYALFGSTGFVLLIFGISGLYMVRRHPELQNKGLRSLGIMEVAFLFFLFLFPTVIMLNLDFLYP